MAAAVLRQDSWFSTRTQILVDGNLHLGQSRKSFESRLAALGYKKDKREDLKLDETRYTLSRGDAWTDPSLRVVYL